MVNKYTMVNKYKYTMVNIPFVYLIYQIKTLIIFIILVINSKISISIYIQIHINTINKT